MHEILKCQFVKNKITGHVPISSTNKEEFINQYRECLEQTKGVNGVAYVYRSEKHVSRLKGASNILYIGETQYDVWSRYYVAKDTENFWHVYEHVVSNYGAMFIDVYVTKNHKQTEKTFLYNYFQQYKELPPMNRKG